MNNKKNSVAARVAAILLLTGSTVLATSSEQVFVDGDLRHAHWNTVFTNTVNLSLDWSAHPDAAKARLDISDISGTTYTTNLAKAAASYYIWRVFESDVPEKEDAYTLTLTFLTAGDAIVGVSTARLAVVQGAFSNAAIDAVEASTTWPKVFNAAVIPYDLSFSADAAAAAPARLVIAKQDGRAETNTFAEAVGFYGWQIVNNGWGFGMYDLSLTFTGTSDSCDATVVRMPDGTMIRLQ
ncbi:MAG: hypothetical protein PHG71_10705 [Kiritimatiellae bacterium]|nr:hypothetical protein [Kiritimatiellia bacterium]